MKPVGESLLSAPPLYRGEALILKILDDSGSSRSASEIVQKLEEKTGDKAFYYSVLADIKALVSKNYVSESGEEKSSSENKYMVTSEGRDALLVTKIHYEAMTAFL